MLDLHKVRQLSADASRQIDQAKSAINQINNSFRGLGSGFTGDPKFSREYSQLSQALKEAERSLERVRSAADAVDKKAR